MEDYSDLSAFLKYSREKLNLTQEELAEKTGVGIHFIRDIEQGKPSLRIDKIDKVLSLFGYRMGPILDTINPYKIWMTYKDQNQAVEIIFRDRTKKEGFLIKELRDDKGHIAGWNLLPLAFALAWKQKENDLLLQQIWLKDIEDINPVITND